MKLTDYKKPKLWTCPHCGKKALFIGVHDDEGNYKGLPGCEYESDPWSGLSYAVHHEGWGDCLLCTDGANEGMGGILFETYEEALQELQALAETAAAEENKPGKCWDCAKAYSTGYFCGYEGHECSEHPGVDFISPDHPCSSGAECDRFTPKGYAIDKRALYKKIAEIEEQARTRFLEAAKGSAEKAGYLAQLSERTAFKHLVADFPTIDGGKQTTPKNDTRYREAVERLGEFGRLFVAYNGDPRGPAGRPRGLSLKDEVLSMPVLEDVDGGRWRPVNEDALRELLTRMDELVADYIGED